MSMPAALSLPDTNSDKCSYHGHTRTTTTVAELEMTILWTVFWSSLPSVRQLFGMDIAKNLGFYNISQAAARGSMEGIEQ
eukprot:1161956-Pelagomonas_calceolata.AAC.3